MEKLREVYAEEGEGLRWRMLMQVVLDVIVVDNHERWPEFYEQMWMMISTENSQNILLAMTCWEKVFKRFEDNRQTAEKSFLWEKLGHRISELMMVFYEAQIDELVQIKTKCASTMLLNVNQGNYLSFSTIFKDILDLELHDLKSNQHSDLTKNCTDEQLNEMLLKLKTKALKFFLTSAMNFCSYDQVEYSDYIFVKIFTETYFEPIVNFWFSTLKNCKFMTKLCTAEQITDKKMFKLCVNIINAVIRNSDQATMILPHCCDLIKENLLQHLVLSEKEIDDFFDNSLEFINMMRCDIEESDTLRNWILDFIVLVANFNMHRDEFPSQMHSLYEFVTIHISSTFEDLSVDFKLKDVLFTLFGCLASPIVATDYWIYDIDRLFKDLAEKATSMPQSQERQILSFRLLYLFEEFSLMGYSLDTTKSITELCLSCLLQRTGEKDHHISCQIVAQDCVQIQASLLLPKLLMQQESVEDWEPFLDEILSVYIFLMMHNHDDIIYSFEDVIKTYSYWIQHHVVEICDSVLDRYTISKQTALYGWLCVISILFEWVEFDPKSVEALHFKVIPIFRQVLHDRHEDCIEIIADSMKSMLKGLDKVHPSLVSLVPSMLSMVYEKDRPNIPSIGYDYFPVMADLISKIIAKDNNSLLLSYTSSLTVFDWVKKCIHSVLSISSLTQNLHHTMACFKTIKALLNHPNLESALEDFISEISMALSLPHLSYFQKLEISECFNACLENGHFNLK
jgi:hypothetical protein